jgi:glyoxylase-like metal-dependent hydrolase (beta-lactamase superfamily II)
MESEKDQAFLANFQKNHPNHFHSVLLTPPTVTFHDRLSLYGGDLTAELFSAPGHCEDHIAAWIPELQLLLAFDAVETPIPLLKNAANAQSMFTTLERFLSLHPQHVLCSHGRTSSPAIIQANLSYFREIERRCRAVLTRHLPKEAELEQASTLIDYSLDEVIAQTASLIDIPTSFDRDFYAGAHDANTRYIMQWLMS